MKKTKLSLIVILLLGASLFSDLSLNSRADIPHQCLMCEWDRSLRAYCMPHDQNGWVYCQAINGPDGGSCNMAEFCQG
jgi:hypothetical protein